MLITPVQIRNNLGIRQSWFQARFGYLVKDFLLSNTSYYDLDECIAFAEKYQSNTRNPKQKAKSEQMMRECLEYMRGLREYHSNL